MKNRKTDYAVKNAEKEIKIEQNFSAGNNSLKILKAYQEKLSNK